MADKNSIEIEANINTKELERQFKQFESKIKQMRLGSSGGIMSQVSGSYAAGNEASKADRIEKMRQRFNQDNRNKLIKDLKEQEKLLDKHEKMYLEMDKATKTLTENTEKHTKAIQEKDKAEKEYLNTLKKIELIQGQLGKGSMADAFRGKGMGPFTGYEMARMKAGFGRFGFGRGMREFGRAGMNAIRRNPYGAATLATAAGTAAQATGDYIGRTQLAIRTFGERRTKAEAGITQALSESSRLQSERRGYEMSYYGPERMKAMELTKTRMDAERKKDEASTMGTAVKIGIGLGAVLAAVPTGGASLTLGAAALGTAGIGLMASGANEIMTNDRKRSMLFDEDAYGKLIGAKGAKTYKEMFEAQKQKDPKKMLAKKFFEQNRQRMLRTQRAFGLSDEELFSGEESIYSRASRAGFSGDIVEQQMMAMQAAGGTTAAGKQGGIFAAQMARGLNLTNAASLIGKVSGRTGGTAADSRDEIIRMYAEATKLGLNESEVRDLLQTSNQIAYQSGVSGQGIQQIIQEGVGTKSRRGIEAATSAFQNIRKRTGSMEGLNLQFAMAEYGSEDFSKFIKGFGGDPKKLTASLAASLSGEDVGEIGEGNKTIENIMAALGIDVSKLDKDKKKKLFAGLQKMSLSKTFRANEADLYKQLTEKEKSLEGLTGEDKEKVEFEIKGLRGLINALLTQTRGQAYQNLDTKQKESLIDQEKAIQSGQYKPGATKEDIAAADKKAKEKDTGLIIDKYIAGEAKSFANQVGFLKEKMVDLTTAFEQAAKSSAWDALEQLAYKLISQGKMTDEGLAAMRRIQREGVMEGSLQDMMNMFGTNDAPNRKEYVTQGPPED